MAGKGTGQSLEELEYSWFAQRVGSSSSAVPINELKKIYFQAQLSGATGSLKDLEAQWLRKYISGAGGTPSSTNHLSILWREAVVISGGTASDRLTENQRKFYSTVST